MTSIPVEGQYEYYRCIHHDFNEAYKMVNQYVSELYLLPKKLIDNTAPVLNKFINDYSFTEPKSKNAVPYDAVLEFIQQLDEFTEETQELLKEHKAHTDKSKTYLKRVAELNEKNTGRIISEYALEYVELTPELSSLNDGLKKIKARADEMVDKLEQLEIRWKNIRVKVRA